jgi:hypothetical protein
MFVLEPYHMYCTEQLGIKTYFFRTIHIHVCFFRTIDIRVYFRYVSRC